MGHIIEKSAITVDLEHVKVFMQIVHPIGQKETKSFLGKVNFLRQLISVFS